MISSHLRSVTVKNYRSIGDEGLDLGQLGRINLLIGQNNSGKSNVIRLFGLLEHFRRANVGSIIKVSNLDFQNKSTEIPISIGLKFRLPEDEQVLSLKNLIDEIDLHLTLRHDGKIESIASGTLATPHGSNYSIAERWWKDRRSFSSGYIYPEQVVQEYNNFISTQALSSCLASIPTIHIIPEFRQIRSGETYDYGGSNLIRTLAALRDPLEDADTEKKKFLDITKFFRELSGLPNAELSIPPDHSKIIVDDGKNRLPLGSYGTGIHESVIILTAVLSNDGEFFAIEEPEIHLHPRLQNQLVNFFLRNTSSSFLLSTHSPTIINSVYSLGISGEPVNLVHIEKLESGSRGRPITKDHQILSSIRDLGFSASDLLQANCIIWVEGPSDRIYLQKWLSLIDGALVEGLHYQYLYYGGRLLSKYKLSSAEEELNDFINILHINRNSFIMIDSDKSKESDSILSFKLRIKTEADNLNAYCWITEGREIENYVDENSIGAVFSKNIGDIKISLGKFSKIETVVRTATLAKYGEAGIRNYASDKVKYAERIVANMGQKIDFRFDLKERVVDLANFIRRSNNLAPILLDEQLT